MNVRLGGCLLGLAVLIAAAPAAAQEPLGDRSIPSPFEVIQPGGIQGVATLGFDPGTWQALDRLHEPGTTLGITGFPLPGGGKVDLLLRSVEVMAPDAAAVVVTADGERRVRPTVAMFAGHAPGRSSYAFLAVSPGMVNGYLVLEDDLLLLSSGGDQGGGVAWLADARAFPPMHPAQDWCKAIRSMVGSRPLPPPGTPEQASMTTEVHVCDMFVEADNAFRALFNSDQEAINYATTLVGASNEIYRRDIGAPIQIPNGYLRVWNQVPPWGPISSFGDIDNVRAWWDSNQNPNRNIPRAGVHVLTNPVFGGVAYYPALCRFDYGYALSSVFGFFPYPIQHTHQDNWDLFVISHEWGHNFGSDHTFNYNPPIQCDDGSGPDKGTIMSYCHQNAGGVLNVGMRFHARVQEVIRAYVDGQACPTLVTLEVGDYDYNGSFTSADLAAFDQVVNQGFASAGALESLDMDGNGVLDACDRQYLDDLVNGYPLALAQGALQRGQPVTFTVTGANPGETVVFLYSLAGQGRGQSAGKLGGLCLDLAPAIQVTGTAVANGAGTAVLNRTVPNNAPLQDVATQAVVRRGAGGADSVKSNPIEAPILP